jgi:hypothetical protein
MEKADKKICLGINKIQAGIILAHCDANEKRRYQYLNDSDIMDILDVKRLVVLSTARK